MYTAGCHGNPLCYSGTGDCWSENAACYHGNPLLCFGNAVCCNGNVACCHGKIIIQRNADCCSGNAACFHGNMNVTLAVLTVAVAMQNKVLYGMQFCCHSLIINALIYLHYLHGSSILFSYWMATIVINLLPLPLLDTYLCYYITKKVFYLS